MNPLCLLLLLLLHHVAVAQAQRPQVDVFRLEEGLPSTEIIDLEQAPDGRLWILTRAGLTTYDGRRFTPPAAGNPGSVLGALHITPEGAVWATGVFFGESLYFLDSDRSSWISVPVPWDFEQYESSTSAFTATQTHALLGSARYGLLIWDGRSWTHLAEEEGLDPRILSLHASGNDVWIGSGSGLCVLRNVVELDCDVGRPDPAAAEPILAITPARSSEDGVWLLSPSRLRRIDPQGRTHPAPAEIVLPELEFERATLAISPTGAFVLANRHHAYLLGEDRNLRLGVRSGLPGEGASRVLYDREGNLWTANPRGLAKIESFRFLTLDQSQGLVEDEVSSLLEIEPGRILIGQNKSLAIFQDGSLDLIPLEASASGVSRTLDLALGANGVVWIAAADIGLLSFHPDQKPYRLKNRDFGEAVFAVEVAPDGVLWVLTTWKLWRNRGDDFELVVDFKDRALRWLTFADDGRPLLSTRNGVLIPDGDDWKASAWKEASGPTPETDNVYRLVKHPDGRYLAATGGGLCVLDEARLIPLNIGYEGPVYSAIIDRDQRLWLGTADGVRISDGEGFRHLTVRHGLAGRETNRGAVLVDHLGQVWMGTARGVSYYQEHLDTPRRVPPSVRLEALSIGERSWPLDRPVRLAPDERDFRIRLRAISFTHDEESTMRYRLEGFDDSWIESPLDESVRYTNVPPGNYAFRVSVGRDGNWSSEVVSEPITMPRRLRHEPAFQAAFVALSILAIFGAHRLRMISADRRTKELETFNHRLRQTMLEKEHAQADRERLIAELENKNRELDQFTRTVSHDLKAPLTTIRGFAGLARRDAAAQRLERLVWDIDNIDKSIDRMNRLINDLLELSCAGEFIHQPQPVPLQEAAQEAISLLAGQIAERGAIITVDDDLPVVLGDYVRLTQVFQNLIGNAIKFLEEDSDPRIEVSCKPGKGGVTCCVRDRGPGIAPNHLENAFNLFERLGSKAPGTGVGLPLVKRIIEAHNGCVWIKSEGLGQGARFYFFLPTTSA